MVAVCPNNHEMVLRFASFRYIKIIWFGLKNGRDESAPTPCGMFAEFFVIRKTPLLALKKGGF